MTLVDILIDHVPPVKISRDDNRLAFTILEVRHDYALVQYPEGHRKEILIDCKHMNKYFVIE